MADESALPHFCSRVFAFFCIREQTEYRGTAAANHRGCRAEFKKRPLYLGDVLAARQDDSFKIVVHGRGRHALFKGA